MTESYDQIGPIKLVQSASGVKASIDGLLLARFLRPSPDWYVADLGCGNGFVGLLLARESPFCRIVGIEIQEGLVRQAAENARINGLANARFVRADLKNYPWPEELDRFDLVVANPPYRKVGTGRISPDPERAAARHELHGEVGDFARAAAALLRDGGASTWIYLARRFDDLTEAVESAGMEPFRTRFVVSREGEEPSLVLLEAIKGGGVGMAFTEEPLVLYREGSGRDYTEEARGILYGGNA
ncbi:MAG: methyltransferase domain-containing protein [bacterium]|nr:methyltransferase domain-containing protein [bacterium]